MGTVRFSTGQVHPRDRFTYWHEIACRVFVEHECKAADEKRFQADVQSFELDTLRLSTYSNVSMDAWRTQKQISHANGDQIFACFQISSSSRISQGGRDCEISRGDFTIVDTQREYRFFYPDLSKQLVIAIPRKELEARIGPINQLTAVAFDSSSEPGSLATGFAHLIADHKNLPGAAQHMVASQALDLISLALSSKQGGPVRLSSSRAVSLTRLKSVVESRLADCDVRCEELAGAARMSVRYANELLSQEDTSLERLLWQRRLSRCRDALGAPAQAHRTISEIAYAWGFRDVSHFGRVFKAAFGLTPREYREETIRKLARTNEEDLVSVPAQSSFSSVSSET